MLIAAVGVMFVAMVSLIFYHSQWKIYRHGQPATALLVLEGTPEHDGAVITAESFGVPVARVKLGRDNRYTARLRLPPGEYIVKMQQRGREPVQSPFKMTEYLYLLYHLRKPTTLPS